MQLTLTKTRRINLRAGLIRLLRKILPAPWTLVFLISSLYMLFILLAIISCFTGADFR